MKFHIVSLPHTQVTPEYCWCAYTSKVRRFCNMMHSLGHEVYLYAGTENEANVTEFIPIISDSDREKWFGNINWNDEVFGGWDPSAEWWVSMNLKAIEQIRLRARPGDFLGIIAGRCQEMITQAFSDLRSVEWGIGYEGVLNGFRVFESSAWMHYLYGKIGITDGKFYDTVIPNAFDFSEFEFSYKKDDYLLYLGRLTPRKGLEVVQLLAKNGHKVVTAGQGDIRVPGCEHLGVVRGQQKKNLLANARAVLVPTFYIEPFGGVAVEAMLSGTPVITTDFGAFTETVIQGITGFRCSTMADFYKAAEAVDGLDPLEISRKSSYYLTENIKYKYQDYFKRLQNLDHGGWYSKENL